MSPFVHRSLLFQLGLAYSLTFAGCGGGSNSDPATPTNSAPVTQIQPEQTSQAAPIQSEPPQQVDPTKKETKWIGKIPYDVFYDQPLTIAADTTALQGSTTVASNANPAEKVQGEQPAMAAETPMPTGQSPAANAVDWAKVIPIAVLDDEIKQIRTRLTTNLQAVGSYNRAIKDVALDGAILCTMASIATVHPEEFNWKGKAKYIRDLSYQIYTSAEGTGRTPFMACQEPFEKINIMLDGGPAPEMESEDVVDHADNVYTAEMMKRIELSFNNLKANINTEARMNEDPVAIERELHVLAAFGTLMGTPSFENVDDPKYQGFLASFTNGALAGVDAVKTKNFVGFQDSLNQIQTTCAECHQQFRGSDTGF